MIKIDFDKDSLRKEGYISKKKFESQILITPTSSDVKLMNYTFCFAENVRESRRIRRRTKR